MYGTLYFSINKNLFFEKYPFLNVKIGAQSSAYIGYFLLKNYVLITLGFGLVYYFSQNLLLCGILVVGYLLSEYMQINADDWMLFERADFVLAFPKAEERFITLFLGNIVYSLILSSNIVFYGGICILCFKEYWKIVLIGLTVYILLFILFEMNAFCIRFSNRAIKKIYAFLGYIFSLFGHFLVFFVVLQSMIYVIQEVIHKSISFSSCYGMIKALILRLMQLVSLRLLVVLFGVFLLYTIVMMVIVFHKIKYEEYKERDDAGYISEYFILLSICEKILNRLYAKGLTKNVLVKKEIALFANAFQYNYRNYYYVFLPDRTIAILAAVLAVMSQYSLEGLPYLLYSLFPCFFLLDINSSVTVKLSLNMSFISDYHLLRLYQMQGKDIKELLDAKLIFYRCLRAGTIVFFLILMNVSMMYFYCSMIGILSTNVLCVLIWGLFPQNYLFSNLIYTRMDYDHYEKYLQESNILEMGIKEFFPLDVLYKIMSIGTVLRLVILLFSHYVGFLIREEIYVAINVGIILCSIYLCNRFMRRIGKNILQFIKKGDYSVDFAKVFKS